MGGAAALKRELRSKEILKARSIVGFDSGALSQNSYFPHP